MDSAVQIARIEADRDIAIAKLQARSIETMAEADAEQEVAHAEGVTEGVEMVLSAGAEDDVDTSTVAEEEVIEQPVEGAPIEVAVEAEPEGVIAPPPPEAETRRSPGKQRSGWWAAYR